MRIGMVLINGRGFPPDIRVEKEARALSQAGHEVFILTRKNSDNSPEIEYIQDIGVTVVRADIPKESRFSEALFTLMVYDVHWKKPIEKFVNDYRIEILHVHDLFAIPAVQRISFRLDVPVVADLHENMPAAKVANYSTGSWIKRALKHLLWNYHWMRYKEASALKRCKRIIVVVPEAAKRIIDYGIPREKIVVVSNTEDETTFNFDHAPTESKIIHAYKNDWVVSYIGGIGPHRGIDTTLEAVAKAKGSIPSLRVLIVGVKNEKIRKWLEEECARLGIADHVEIIGWQPFAMVNSYVMASNVCLVPHNNFEHTQTTVPHKLFQYMICKKPVLVSDCAPLKRIVQDAECGVIFTANESQDMADKLIWMYEHQEQLIEMGEKGQKAALGKYSWRHDAQRLVEMYKELVVRGYDSK